MQRLIHHHDHVQRDRCDRTGFVLSRPRFEPLGSDGAEQAVALIAELIAAAARGRDDHGVRGR